VKTKLKLFLFALLISGCSSNRYLLTDKGNDKNFLIETINEYSKNGEISKKPIIVVDGVPNRFDYELKNKKLQLSKAEIKKIESLKNDVGIRLYGDYAKGGVLIVTTNSYVSKEPTTDKNKILFLLEDKAISESEMEKIDPKDIDSIDVIKDKEKVKQYTSENYIGVVIIHLKKK
jgi:uncharacterized protein YcfL